MAYLGRAYFESLDLLSGGSIAVTAAAAVLTVILSVLMMRIDWAMAIGIVQTQGVRGLVANLRDLLRLRKKPRVQP